MRNPPSEATLDPQPGPHRSGLRGHEVPRVRCFLHTVCQEAGCPNIHECWESREATFLIGGDKCTRRCDFCDIATGKLRSWTATSRAALQKTSRRWTSTTPPSRA